MPAKKYVDDARLVGLYESGNSSREVAKQLGVGQGFVLKRLRALGVEIRQAHNWVYSPRKHRRRVFPFELGRAIQMCRDGYTLHAMARELKSNQKTVRARLAEYGIELNVKVGRPSAIAQQLRKVG